MSRSCLPTPYGCGIGISRVGQRLYGLRGFIRALSKEGLPPWHDPRQPAAREGQPSLRWTQPLRHLQLQLLWLSRPRPDLCEHESELWQMACSWSALVSCPRSSCAVCRIPGWTKGRGRGVREFPKLMTPKAKVIPLVRVHGRL